MRRPPRRRYRRRGRAGVAETTHTNTQREREVNVSFPSVNPSARLRAHNPPHGRSCTCKIHTCKVRGQPEEPNLTPHWKSPTFFVRLALHYYVIVFFFCYRCYQYSRQVGNQQPALSYVYTQLYITLSFLSHLLVCLFSSDLYTYTYFYN